MPRKPKPFPVSDEARAYLDAARAYDDRAEEHAASSERMEEVRAQAARRWFTVDPLDSDTPPIPTIEQIEDGLRRFPDVRERIDEVLRDFKGETSAVAFLYDLSNSRDEIC